MEKTANTQQTAIKAKQIVIGLDNSFVDVTTQQRKKIVAGFALENKIIYGRAFDIIKIKSGTIVNLNEIESIQKNFDNIIIYEIKSTSKEGINERFEKYFFALTTAELLVAQNLGNNFKFLFLNTLTHEHLELSLKEIFAKAKGIYPTWSIQF